MAPPNATCRICLSTADEAPEAGALISPCRCKGTSKYVHDSCLRQWRTTSASSKAYYECNTCGYKYQLRRLGWGAAVGSTAVGVTLTILILWATVWLLGFVADPIIELWAKWSRWTSYGSWRWGFGQGAALFWGEDWDEDEDAGGLFDGMGWGEGGLSEHMLKGLSTLGLLGFVKVLFFLGPGAWWNLRGVGRARPGARGRERISTLVLVIGVGTFLWWVWTTVRQWVGDRMGSLRDKVLDIGEGEDEEIYEDERNANTSTGWGNNNTTPMNGTDGFREQDGDSIGVDGEPVVQEDAPQQEEVLLGEGQEDEHEFLRRRERMGTSDRAEEHVY